MSRTAKEMVERAAWWKRRPWPCVVLGVDPAARAGWGVTVPHGPPDTVLRTHQSPEVERGFYVLRARELDTNTRELEAALDFAVSAARHLGLSLVVSLESWGSGGRLGINQWLGMGEAVGAWKRAVQLLVAQGGYNDVLTGTRSTLRVQQSTWRSRVVDESGDRTSGKFVSYDSEGWKRAATRTCATLFPYLQLEGANAAEAVLVAAYTARSDELGRLLPDTYLRRHGFEPLPPEPEGRKRRGKKRVVQVG